MRADHSSMYVQQFLIKFNSSIRGMGHLDLEQSLECKDFNNIEGCNQIQKLQLSSSCHRTLQRECIMYRHALL